MTNCTIAVTYSTDPLAEFGEGTSSIHKLTARLLRLTALIHLRLDSEGKALEATDMKLEATDKKIQQ